MAFLGRDPESDATAELGSVWHDGAQVTAIVFPGQRQNTRSWIQIAAGVAAVVVLPILVAGQPGLQGNLLTILVVVLLMGLVLWALWLTWRDLPRISISSGGVHAGYRSQVFVPWAAIDDVEPYDTAFNAGLRLELMTLEGVEQPLLGRATTRAMSSPRLVMPMVRGRSDEAASMILHYLVEPDQRADLAKGQLPSDIHLAHKLRPNWQRRTMSGLWMAWILIALASVLIVGVAAIAQLLS